MALLKKYYEHKGLELSIEEQIAFGILRDLCDRSGLENEWERIDEDIQEEILEAWVKIVKSKLPKKI